MRYLGLDLGSKTLGMALSDKTGLIASSLKIVRHNEEYDRLVNEVVDVVDVRFDEIVKGHDNMFIVIVRFGGKIYAQYRTLYLDRPISIAKNRHTFLASFQFV